MRTVVFDDEVSVSVKGYTPDPPGSVYCVMDYVHDELAHMAARHYASNVRDRKPALSEALFASLQGEPEEPVLRIHQVEFHVPVHEDGRWVVLNYSREYAARVAMRTYWLKCEQADLVTRIDDALESAEPSFIEYLQSKHPKKKTKKKAKRS